MTRDLLAAKYLERTKNPLIEDIEGSHYVYTSLHIHIFRVRIQGVLKDPIHMNLADLLY